MIVSCPKCGKRFRLASNKVTTGEVRLKCTSCGQPFTAGSGSTEHPARASRNGLSVLVAHNDAGFCDTVEGMLADEGISVTKSFDGYEALSIIESQRPQVVLLDVALPSLYGMVLCEKIKSSHELKDIKVILIASVYNNMRYRRTPSKLYGADEYIEKDFICRDLLPKLKKLVQGFDNLASAPATNSGIADGGERAKKEHPGSEGKAQAFKATAGLESAGDKDTQEKAARLARIIVADIMLYHRKKIDLDVNKANIFEIFKNEINEGIKYFNKRLPNVQAKNYLIDAFKEVLSQEKAATGGLRNKAAGG